MPRIPAIDADGHVQEPRGRLGAPPRRAVRGYAPRTVRDERGRVRQVVGGELKPYIPVPAGDWQIPTGGHDPKQRLADMTARASSDRCSIPRSGCFFAGLERADVQVALCRAYNDWLHEFCGADARRLLGIALVPQCDLAEALGEARRCVRELGFRGVMMRPNPVRTRTLGDPYWDPLWTLLEDLDVPLAVQRGARPRTCRSRAATASRTSRCATSARTRTNNRSPARRS